MKENKSKKQNNNKPFAIPAETIKGIDVVCDELKDLYGNAQSDKDEFLLALKDFLASGAQSDRVERFKTYWYDSIEKTRIVWHKTVDVFRERLKGETINNLLTQNIISKTNFNNIDFLKDHVLHPLLIINYELLKEYSSFVKILSLPGIKYYSESWSEDLKKFLSSRINIIINDYYTIKTGESINANIKLERRSPVNSSKLAVSKLYLEIIKIAKEKDNPKKYFKNTWNQIMEKCNYDYKEKFGFSDEEMKKIDEKIKIIPIYLNETAYWQHNFSKYYIDHLKKGESREDIIQGLRKNIFRLSQI